ncbi:MAG: hypothetical protein IKO55_16965 [Kiritimatiellae bacterium]|nr:hypothetical protein [Kiritimatiellia bacterium]
MQFIKECLFPSLGVAATAVLIAIAISWFIHAINSVVRAADALEQIADALEDDGEEIKEEKKGGAE